jgi:hypothetical protein
LLRTGEITPPCGTPRFPSAFSMILSRCNTSSSLIPHRTRQPSLDAQWPLLRGRVISDWTRPDFKRRPCNAGDFVRTPAQSVALLVLVEEGTVRSRTEEGSASASHDAVREAHPAWKHGPGEKTASVTRSPLAPFVWVRPYRPTRSAMTRMSSPTSNGFAK